VTSGLTPITGYGGCPALFLRALFIVGACATSGWYIFSVSVMGIPSDDVGIVWSLFGVLVSWSIFCFVCGHVMVVVCW